MSAVEKEECCPRRLRNEMKVGEMKFTKLLKPYGSGQEKPFNNLSTHLRKSERFIIHPSCGKKSLSSPRGIEEPWTTKILFFWQRCDSRSISVYKNTESMGLTYWKRRWLRHCTLRRMEMVKKLWRRSER